MATYRITGPDGGTYQVSAPDDASEQDVLSYVQSNAAKAPRSTQADAAASAQNAAQSFRDLPPEPAGSDESRSFTLDSANIPADAPTEFDTVRDAARDAIVTGATKAVRAASGGAGEGAAAGVALAADPEAKTPFQRIRSAVTGYDRTEYPDAQEFTPALVSATKQPQPAAMGSAVTPDENAQLDILKANYPGLEIKRDKYENVMLRAPGMKDWAYLNKPGVSGRDFDELGTQTLVTLPLAGLFGMGGSIPARVATGALGGGGSSVVQDVAAMAQGSEQGIDGERAAIATGLGAATGPLLGKPAAQPARTATTEAIEAAERQGIQIPRGAASDNLAAKPVAGALKEIPWVGHPLVEASQKATKGVEDRVGQIVDNLGSGSQRAAGNAVKDDLLQWARVGSEEAADKLFTPVKRALRNKRGDLSNTANAVSTLVGRSSEAFLEAPTIVNTINKSINDAVAAGGISFDGMHTLRQEIGKRLSGAIVAEPGLDKEALKTLYAALTADMEKMAGRQGSRARVAWDNAVDLFKKDIVTRRDAIEKVLGETGSASAESVAGTLRTMAGTGKGADFQQLLQIKRTVGESAWDELASAVIADMGRTADGFSVAKFRTAYDKLSTSGKHALFSQSHKQALDDLALVSTKFAALERLGNPSGSARIGLIATSIPTAIVSMVMAPTSAALGASGVVAGRFLAKALAKPATAKALSKWSNAYLMAASSKNRAAMAVFQEAERKLLDAMRSDGLDINEASDNSAAVPEQSRLSP